MACPINAYAVKERLQVAAIDFGTTYSGYAFSFRSHFLKDPLRVNTNNWPNKQDKYDCAIKNIDMHVV